MDTNGYKTKKGSFVAYILRMRLRRIFILVILGFIVLLTVLNISRKTNFEQENEKILQKREKRNLKLNLDVNQNTEFIPEKTKRYKKQALFELEKLKSDYKRCKKSSSNDCYTIYLKIQEHVKDIRDNLVELTELLKEKNFESKELKFIENHQILNETSNMPEKFSFDLLKTWKLDSTTIGSTNKSQVKETTDITNSTLETITPLKSIVENLFTTLSIPVKSSEIITGITSTMSNYNISTTPSFSSSENEIEETELVKNEQKLSQNDYMLSPKVHEDIAKKVFPNNNWHHDNIHHEQPFMEQWEQRDGSPHSNLHHVGNVDQILRQSASDSSKLQTFTHPDTKNHVMDVSGPFLSLCEQLLRNSDNNQLNLKTQNGNLHGQNLFNEPHNNQLTGRGPFNFPGTGETMKSTAQISFNPGFSMMSHPICFFTATPNNMRLQNFQSFSPTSQNIGNNFGVFGTNQGGFIYIPPNLAGNVGNFANSGTGSGITAPLSRLLGQIRGRQNLRLGTTQPFFCTYMPGFSGTNFRSSEIIENNKQKSNKDEDKNDNIPLENDIVYATYVNRIPTLVNFTTRNNDDSICPPGTKSCHTTHQCIPRTKWCNSISDCMDSSDETACTCKSRIAAEKLCDGYPDCPMAEDELGCFGCEHTSLSCYTDSDEYLRAKKSTISMCYSLMEKCDGYENCLNGNDEKDCSILVPVLGHHTSYATSSGKGVLHHNYKGRWYPVCKNPEKWAREACDADVGPIYEDPIINIQPSNIPGPFIHQQQFEKDSDLNELDNPDFDNLCPDITGNIQGNILNHVTCPQIKCGHSKIIERYENLEITKRSLIQVNMTTLRNKRMEERIVGGKACKPMQWPFIIGLYRDGRFHCGGIIFNEEWIITAAHCVTRFSNHYYEIRAGMLRRDSFSPTLQISKVAHIIIHEKYSSTIMNNDIALLHLETPLRFNRWVRPTCLPNIGRSGLDNNWRLEPSPGTICYAVGWGALREKGPDPDNLREVSIPITTNCKHKIDQNIEEICAGELDGGRDACQGDSGGPLFCQSITDPNEWYTAGLISHGDGCARPDEPGVYTRVSMFIEWIHENTQPGLRAQVKKPRQICPGHVCVWGGQRCMTKSDRCNGIVDCLGGEDEAGCPFNHSPDVGNPLKFNNNSSEISREDFDIITEIGTTTETISTDPDTTTTTIKEILLDFKIFNIKGTTDIIDTTTDIPNEDHTKFKESEISTETNNNIDHFNDPNPIHQENEVIKPGNIEKIKRENETKPEKQIDIKREKFECSKIPQSISLSHKCDKKIDCEDGTDEEDCTCRDYLTGPLKRLICNGNIDCKDLTDEKDCGNCTIEQFQCTDSNICIEKTNQCNGKSDCPNNEDEQNCFTLTDKNFILIDANMRPCLQSFGIFARNENGKWRIVCSDEVDLEHRGARIAGEICTILGFGGYKFYNTTELNHSQEILYEISDRSTTINPSRTYRVIGKHRMTHYDYPAYTYDVEEINRNERNEVNLGRVVANPSLAIEREKLHIIENSTCRGIYVECVATTNGIHSKIGSQAFVELLKPPTKEIHEPFIELSNKTIETNNYYPWKAQIFVNGEIRCFGVLIDRNWILAKKNCIKFVRVETDSIAISVGFSGLTWKIRGPFQQTGRVDCIHHIDGSNVIVLRIEEPFQLNQHVLPTYIPTKSAYFEEFIGETIECLALSYDTNNNLITVPLEEDKNSTNCSKEEGQLCFKEIASNTTTREKECKNRAVIHEGIIICREEGTGWYPKGFYILNKMNCEQNNIFIVSPLDKFYQQIQRIMNFPQCDYIFPHQICTTFLCSAGNCLTNEQICNGKADCHDGSDEDVKFCQQQKNDCKPSELKCRTGKCVSKTKFCDHINDCEDLTDEPGECSCLSYLRTTDSKKICDGIRNCFDKSDENPYLCDCKDTSFRCGSSGYCVPREYVCDKEPDCPLGEDETYCYGIEKPLANSMGYGLVMEQNFGLWHTKCFPRSMEVNNTEISKICKLLGFSNYTNISYRTVEEFTSREDINEDNNKTLKKYSIPQKASVINKFTPLKLNHALTLYIKPSRPLVKLTDWEKDDYSNCQRIEIKCS